MGEFLFYMLTINFPASRRRVFSLEQLMTRNVSIDDSWWQESSQDKASNARQVPLKNYLTVRLVLAIGVSREWLKSNRPQGGRDRTTGLDVTQAPHLVTTPCHARDISFPSLTTNCLLFEDINEMDVSSNLSAVKFNKNKEHTSPQ
jgi:hypothetical protein